MVTGQGDMYHTPCCQGGVSLMPGVASQSGMPAQLPATLHCELLLHLSPTISDAVLSSVLHWYPMCRRQEEFP
jgi:hypothetical protein